MTKNKYWLADLEGTKVAVPDAASRDYLIGLGWDETSEATGDEFVWVRHPDVADGARIPAASLEIWEVRGWEPGFRPVDRLDDALVAEEPATAASKPNSKPKSAAGGDTREN